MGMYVLSEKVGEDHLGLQMLCLMIWMVTTWNFTHAELHYSEISIYELRAIPQF